MVDQLRHNSGKPKLSYWATNARTMRLLATHARLVHGAHAVYIATELGIVDYLCRHQGDLAAVVFQCIVDVQNDTRQDPGELFSDVCVYGEGKYERGNYRRGSPVTPYLDCALRHIAKRQRGELLDPESKLPHGAHVLWNVVEAYEQPEWRDDRLPALQWLEPEGP